MVSVSVAVWSGNTSTDVEKTSTRLLFSACGGKHLHGRGEDGPWSPLSPLSPETPPRTWRRLNVLNGLARNKGNTSTDVEKTIVLTKQELNCIETPPRTWRRLTEKIVLLMASGNTSTDVEKTEQRRPGSWWNSETPPRTWRRLSRGILLACSQRNTSTDVEKTLQRTFFFGSRRKHLHGRGEDHRVTRYGNTRPETPPRTWRRLDRRRILRLRPGNTSTDVEKTRHASATSKGASKHLHGRGEDTVNQLRRRPNLETPPRTWRRLCISALQFSCDGNTSTDVEKTARFSVRLIQPTLLFVVVVVKGGSLTN